MLFAGTHNMCKNGFGAVMYRAGSFINSKRKAFCGLKLKLNRVTSLQAEKNLCTPVVLLSVFSAFHFFLYGRTTGTKGMKNTTLIKIPVMQLSTPRFKNYKQKGLGWSGTESALTPFLYRKSSSVDSGLFKWKPSEKPWARMYYTCTCFDLINLKIWFPKRGKFKAF